MYFYIEFYSGDEFEEETDYGHIEAENEFEAECIFECLYPDGEIVKISLDEYSSQWHPNTLN